MTSNTIALRPPPRTGSAIPGTRYAHRELTRLSLHRPRRPSRSASRPPALGPRGIEIRARRVRTCTDAPPHTLSPRPPRTLTWHRRAALMTTRSTPARPSQIPARRAAYAETRRWALARIPSAHRAPPRSRGARGARASPARRSAGPRARAPVPGGVALVRLEHC